jgi:hypothetical protein
MAAAAMADRILSGPDGRPMTTAYEYSEDECSTSSSLLQHYMHPCSYCASTCMQGSVRDRHS